MTRKTHKGIVGKAMPTSRRRYLTGIGLGFKEENLTSTQDIDKFIKEQKNNI